MKMKNHLLKLIVCVVLAVLFNVFIYFFKGEKAAVEFLGGYLIEMILSLDNLFLFILIFSTFHIPPNYQTRILKYGILGAMILRLVFILLGVSVISKFHSLIYFFGVILIVSGIKMLFFESGGDTYENIKILKILNKVIPVTNRIYGHNFIVIINKVLYATPLLVALIIIEFSDIMFALDSIPAIFSITLDPFIIYSSNIWAIIGLRSMYYILAKMNSKFIFMKYGVGFILIFTGVKLSILYLGISISTIVSILIIMTILLTSILVSLVFSDTNYRRKSISENI